MDKFLRPSILIPFAIAAASNPATYRLIGLPPIVQGTANDLAFGQKCAQAFFQRARVSKSFDSTASLETAKSLGDSLKQCGDGIRCYAPIAFHHNADVALFTRIDRRGKVQRIHFSWFDVRKGLFRGASALEGVNLADLESRLPKTIEVAVAKGAGIWHVQLQAPLRGSAFPGDVVTIPAGRFTKAVLFRQNDTTTFNREFRISEFKTMKTEVTWTQYQVCVQSGACIPAQYSDGTCSKVWDDGSWFPGLQPEPPAGSDLPVVCVDWIQARDYCAWVGGDLPTQMQWEYMARAGETGPAPWANPQESCLHANLRDLDYIKNRPGFEPAFDCRDGYEGLAPVGRFPANSFGVQDLVGNVREWVRDNFSPLLLSKADSLDPHCEEPTGNSLKMSVGSSFAAPGPRNIEFARRDAGWPGSATESTGFRCVEATAN